MLAIVDILKLSCLFQEVESTPQEGLSPASVPILPQTPRGGKEAELQPEIGQSFGAGFDFDNMSTIWDSNLPLLIPIDFDGSLSSFDMSIS